jgi:hypothetical protein
LVQRLLTAVLLIMTFVVGSALPASAHTVSGVGATNWVSKVTSVQPQLPGLTIKVIELGSRLELRNTGPEVVVLGYSGEPYLRVGPLGVFQNINSPSSYLNRTRNASFLVPPGLATDPGTVANWQKVSAGQVVRWHDHRIHWMGAGPPPDVRQAPNRVHARPPWQVLLHQGTTPIVVSGSLTWEPGPSPWPWLAAAGLIAVACAALGWSRRRALPLAIAAILLVAVDVTHSVGIAAVAGGSHSYQAARFVSGSYYSFVGWGLGVVGVVLLLRNKADGLYAVIFAGASTFLFSGLLDVSTLHQSEAPFAWGINLDRATVIIALGAGAGLAIAALKALRNLPAQHRSIASDGHPAEEEDRADAEIIFLPQRPPADMGAR